MDILFLQFRHFHLEKRYEKIGNNWYHFRVFLHLGHSLLQVKIPLLFSFILHIKTEAKLQNRVQNMNNIVKNM